MTAKPIAMAVIAIALTACSTGTYLPGRNVDSSLVGKKVEIMTGEEKRIVKVKRIENGVIHTESGETFENAHIIDTNPDAE